MPSSSATGGERSHLPTETLDSVRGLAATYVMLNHVHWLLIVGAVSAAAAVHGPMRLLIDALAATRYGKVAVLAFFLVSGYAIHYRQANRAAAGAPLAVNWRAFAAHRAHRLYPPLGVALCLTALLDYFGAHINPSFYSGAVQPAINFSTTLPTITSAIGTLFFVQGIATPMFGTDGPLWSLAYEAFYYLMYPLVLWLNRRIGSIASLATFVLFGSANALLNAHAVQISLLPVLAYWPAWVAGTFIADARAGRVGVPDSWWNAGAGVGAALLCALAALLLAVQSNSVDGVFDYLWCIGLFGIIGWLAAGRHSAVVRGAARRVCRPLLLLGAMSYSLYVVHFPILALLSAWWLANHAELPTTPWLALAGILVSLIVAYGVYRIAERPFTSLGRRAAARPLEARGAAPVGKAAVLSTTGPSA